MTDNQPLMDPKPATFESVTNVNDITANQQQKSSKSNIQALKPLVFKPNSVEQFVPVSDTELDNLQHDEINDQANIWNRLYRLVLILFLLVIFLPLTAVLKNELHIFSIYGFAVLCCAVAYATHLFYLVFKAYFDKQHGLYRVNTLNAMPPKWASMSIAYRALLVRHEPIESISEFSAIQGGVASTMMFGTAVCTMTILSCAFMTEIHQHSFEFTFDDVMIMIGAFGLVTIGTFQLDPNNPWMIRFHYLGVVFSLAIFVAFNVQQFGMPQKHPDKYTYSRVWYPILLDIISFIGFGIWNYVCYIGNNYQKEVVQVENKYDAEYISKLSAYNLGAEGIYFIGAGVSLASWMIFYPYAYCEEFNS